MMTHPATDLTNLTHDLVGQTAALAHAIVNDVATASEAADLVDLVVTLDVELRFSASPLLAHAALNRLIELASELYGRVHFGHPASAHALTVVASAESLAHALRQRQRERAAAAEVSAPFRRVRHEERAAIAS